SNATKIVRSCRSGTDSIVALTKAAIDHPSHAGEPATPREGETTMIKQLNPYLNFNGTAEKAIALYEKALGAKTEGVMRYGDIPGNTPAPQNKNLVIHARLHIGGGVIMISDTTPDMPVPAGNNVHVCLDFDDPADQQKKFDALSVDGK